ASGGRTAGRREPAHRRPAARVRVGPPPTSEAPGVASRGLGGGLRLSSSGSRSPQCPPRDPPGRFPSSKPGPLLRSAGGKRRRDERPPDRPGPRSSPGPIAETLLGRDPPTAGRDIRHRPDPLLPHREKRSFPTSSGRWLSLATYRQ